jgi:hypothetical protein
MSVQIKKGSLGAILSSCNIINEDDTTASLEEQGRTGPQLRRN